MRGSVASRPLRTVAISLWCWRRKASIHSRADLARHAGLAPSCARRPRRSFMGTSSRGARAGPFVAGVTGGLTRLERQVAGVVGWWAGVCACRALARVARAGREGREPALLLPPSLTSGETRPLPMERTSLTVSVVIGASTEDCWWLLQGSVSSPEPDPDGDHQLRQSQRLNFSRGADGTGAPAGTPSVRGGGAGQTAGSSRFGPEFGS